MPLTDVKPFLYAGIGCAALVLALPFAADAARAAAPTASPSPSAPAASPTPADAPTLEALPAPSPNASPADEFAPVLPTVAPGYAAPPQNTSGAATLIGVNAQPFVGIKLEDAIAMALGRNTDLAVAQSNQRIANYQIVAANGAYDVKFQLQPQYQHSSQASVSALESGPNGGPVVSDSAGVTGGLSGDLPGGQHYSATAFATYENSNSILDSYNPYYLTALQFNVTQPLARGTGTNSQRRSLELAIIGARSDRAAALLNASQVVSNVSNAYWNLVSAWRNAGIQEEGLKEAKAQAQSNERQAAHGALAKVDVVESESQVSVFQDNVASALGQVQKLQTQLKQLILANPGDPVWLAELVPTSPVTNLPAEPSLDDLIVSALRNRPEVAQLKAQRESAGVEVAYARDQLKPQIDLNLGYLTAGFAGFPTNPINNPISTVLNNELNAINTLLQKAGNPLPPLPASLTTTPGFIVGGLGKAWRNTLDNRFPTYTVSLTLAFPLGNHTARAQYQISLERKKQVDFQELALLERVRSEAVNALQQLRETQVRLMAAANARAASERVLKAEQHRFSLGSSTTFLVLQRQLEVANNRGRELQAQTDLNNAVVELDRVGGTIFGHYNIDTSAVGLKTYEQSK